MVLKDIIEAVPGDIVLDVKDYDEKRIYLGEAEKYYLRISDEDLERIVFTFFPGKSLDWDGALVLHVYLCYE